MVRKHSLKWFFNGERVYSGVINCIVAIVVLCSMIPLLYVLSGSMMTKNEWMARNGVFLFCRNPKFGAYISIMTKPDVYLATFMSFARALAGSVLSVWFALIAGYAVSKRDFWMGKPILLFIVITMLYAGGLIPSYLVIESTGLIDTFWAFVLPGALGAYGTLVFKQTFENMPQSIVEAAKVDGASEFRILWRIAVPINSATIAVLILFSAVGHWNSWFDAFIYLNVNMHLQPLALYLRNSVMDTESYNGMAESELANDAIRYALAIVGMVPILLTYPFFQKFFVKGVYTGAVKQ